jgi:hypothetical protein
MQTSCSDGIAHDRIDLVWEIDAQHFGAYHRPLVQWIDEQYGQDK